MIDLPYPLYMMETEGLLDTRESAIRNIIKKVKKYPGDAIPDLVFYAICEECGIPAGSLSEKEFNRIKRMIQK